MRTVPAFASGFALAVLCCDIGTSHDIAQSRADIRAMQAVVADVDDETALRRCRIGIEEAANIVPIWEWMAQMYQRAWMRATDGGKKHAKR